LIFPRTFFSSAANFSYATLNPAIELLGKARSLFNSSTPDISSENSEVLPASEYTCAAYFGFFDEAYDETMKVKIPWENTNQIFASFVTISKQGKLVLQTPESHEKIKTIVSLARKANPDIEIFIVSDYGRAPGWIDDHYLKAAENPEKFAKKVLEFLKEYDLNGISIDWQSPFINDYSEELKALLKGCHDLFDKEFQETGKMYKVTHDVDPCTHSPKTVGNLKDVVDGINVMSYLCTDNLKELVQEFSAHGFPKRKISVTVQSELNEETQKSIQEIAKIVKEEDLAGLNNWRMENDSRKFHRSRYNVYGPSRFNVTNWIYDELCKKIV